VGKGEKKVYRMGRGQKIRKYSPLSCPTDYPIVIQREQEIRYVNVSLKRHYT
jgi:hypothetical protein